MSRRLMRTTLLAAGVAAAVASVPATASAQDGFTFNSCATEGVCGWVGAFFNGSILTVRVANSDSWSGSQLFLAQLMFSSALTAGNPGNAFQAFSTASASGPVGSVGTPTPWVFSAVSGDTELDVAGFGNTNTFIEGLAPSVNRPLPGDPDSGVWITGGASYMQFTADLTGLTGVESASLVGLGFCTDMGCVAGTPVATPEPATIALVATGLFGLAVTHRRRKNRLG